MNSLQSVAQPFGAGEIFPLEGMRIWRVPPRHPFDRRLQVEEAMFLNQCGKLRAEDAGPRRLMDDDAAPRFLNRAGARAQVQRDDRAQVDHSGRSSGPRVGKDGVCPCRSPWPLYLLKK